MIIANILILRYINLTLNLTLKKLHRKNKLGIQLCPSFTVITESQIPNSYFLYKFLNVKLEIDQLIPAGSIIIYLRTYLESMDIAKYSKEHL